MRNEAIRRTAVLAAVLTLGGSALWAQYREYYVRGRVVDLDKKPVEGAEIRLVDRATSRDYGVKTGKDGMFKLAGLPHGVYDVTIAREGYVTRTDEWKFETPQDTMQKVDVPEVVLGSQAQAEARQRLKEAEAGVKQAAEALRTGDPDRTLALVKPVLDRDPKDANALFLAGVAHLKKKEYREAVDALGRVTELAPAFPGAYFQLALGRRGLDDLDGALAAYDRALELDPGNADAAYNSGLVLLELNRVTEALARFERGLAIRPADPDLHEMAGRCCIHESRFEEAVSHFQKARAATNDPEKARALDDVIRTLREQIH